jgi:hypothetical protein
MAHRDLNPDNVPLTLTLAAAELARWRDAAAADGATSVEQWLTVLAASRCNALGQRQR